MKKVYTLISLILALIMITACPSPSATIELSNEKALTSFSFTATANTALIADVTGTITGNSITATLPYGTDTSALVASFETTGTAVSIGNTAQISGTTANDFSSTVVYRVTAEDGSTQDYEVTTIPAAATRNEITAFSFTAAANTALTADVTGTITGNSITATLPYGTDTSALVASFETTGTAVSIGNTAQISGTTANDFSSTVVYRVTAEDGSTQNYEVTVSVASNTAKEITAFSFTAASNIALDANVTGTFEENNIIRVNVPAGTVLTSLTAEFSLSAEARLSLGGAIQESGSTSNDFSGDVVYSVTAEDGSTKEYTVWVLTTVPDRSTLDTMIANGEDVSRLDTSLITDMSYLFYNRYTFNQDISRWDVSSVTDMSLMFYSCYAFNQDIGEWDVSSVTDMEGMFKLCNAFNQDIGEWDVSSVTDMGGMFAGCDFFNQQIGEWDVSSVTFMRSMFSYCDAFNQDIGEWDVSSVTDMVNMFFHCDVFNQDIREWDVSNVTNMGGMFGGCYAFDQNIGEWDVSSVTNMGSMFGGCYAFNQNIGEWDVSSVTSMYGMFAGCDAFNQDIGEWDVSSVIYMSNMFNSCDAFNQDLSSWADHVAETISHTDFSSDAPLFETVNHPYTNWDN